MQYLKDSQDSVNRRKSEEIKQVFQELGFDNDDNRRQFRLALERLKTPKDPVRFRLSHETDPRPSTLSHSSNTGTFPE